MAGNTFTWSGGIGNWFDPTHWTAVGAPTNVPASGASIIINGGTISLNGTDEITNVPTFGDELTPLVGESVTLGSANPSAPAAIVATSALFGRYVTITSAGTNADALLAAIGPTGFTGAIIADASGGTFTINATQADGGQQADLVLLTDSSVVVEGGDNLLLDGLLTAEASYTISAGGTLTNDGTIRMFSGGGTLSAGSTITGTGTFIVNPDTTLYDEIAIPATQTVAIDGAGRLDIGTISVFAGDIINLGLGGTIDLLNTIANYASYNAGTGKLTIENNGSTIGTLNVQGPASGTLTTAGGTVITVPGSVSRVSYEITTGAQALGANIVQATMKSVTGAPITGAGIKIGIISDSFNATLNGVVDPAHTAAQLGYLPATSSGTSAVTVLQDSSASGVANEGLAMTELVHQVAPGAQIYFYSGEGTQDNFANGINALVNVGANIIVDDFSYNDTPFFQIAGPIDTAVQNAISAGVDYFTAASNYGAAYFQAAWQPIAAQLTLPAGGPPEVRGDGPSVLNVTVQAVSAQLFDNGTVFQTITVPGSLDASIDLQWNAPWPAQNGSSVPDSLGMALYDTNGNLVASSTQVTDAADGYGGLPEISLSVPGSSTTTNYQLAIYQIAGEPTVSQFKYIVFGSPTSVQDPGAVIDDPDAGIGSGTVHGWELVPGVNTVGAAYWANSPAYNVASNWTEWFSSAGPGQLLFNQTGTALSPSVLAGKIDFVAPDGVDTSVPGFQGFYGTSAAAPDAAAVAALMLQADPKLTPAQVTSMLEQSAVSMGLPAADEGAGLIQAPGAVQLALDAAIQTAPCFAAGTRIATARGEVAVEDLKVGDLALTLLTKTADPILWIGCRQVDCANHAQPKRVWPIRVAANAFGPDLPHAELYLSPDHAIYIRNVLIPIKHLVNDTTIAQVKVERVTYYHVELPRHDVVLAHGLPAESYLDVKDRSDFANGLGPVKLYPDFSTRMWEAFGCAKLVVTGSELQAARALVEAQHAGTAGTRQLGDARAYPPYKVGSICIQRVDDPAA